MQPLRSSLHRARWALVVASLARPALGAEPSCTGVTVTAHSSVVGRWPTLVERVRSALTERTDIDRCARAHLGTSRESITLEVSLDDGRSTIRRLSSAADVVPALEALLLLPEPAEPEPAEPAPAELAPATESARRPREPETKLAPLSSQARRPSMSERDAAELPEPGVLPERDRGVGLLLSIGGGQRMGDSQTSGNLGAMALLRISSWLVGVDGRAVTYEVPVSDGIPQSATELTAVAGYRFGQGMLALDLMLGPTLVVQQDMEITVGPAPERESTTISRLVPRLFFGSRLTLGASSVLGGFVGVEGAAGPSGASRNPASHEPVLPQWMLGFVAGVTLGIL